MRSRAGYSIAPRRPGTSTGTADIYQFGEPKVPLSDFLAADHDDFILATKFHASLRRSGDHDRG
jgi:aryl-alcohol dehydrogenase-like predicted oxidoreductase